MVNSYHLKICILRKKEKKGFFRRIFSSKQSNNEENPLLVPAGRTIKNSQITLNNVDKSNDVGLNRSLRNSPFLSNGLNVVKIDTQMLNVSSFLMLLRSLRKLLYFF